jgi:hypothetical protein
MPAFQKFNCFAQDIGRKVHNLHTDTLKVMLTNTAPSASNTVKTDITEIATGNGYSAGGTAVTGQSYTQTAGQGKLTASDVTITAVGGSIAAFRYAVLYNDTATNDELIGWWDYGASLTITVGNAVLIDFNATTGILTVGA